MVQFTDTSTSAFPIKSRVWHMGFWVNGKEVTSRAKNPKIHYYIEDLIGSVNCKVT
jgi:PKD repeat protein